MGKHRDWTAVRAEYLTGKLSYSQLAAKYKIPLDTLKKAAIRQGWAKDREDPEQRKKAAAAERSIREAEKKLAPRPKKGTAAETAPPEAKGTETDETVVLDAEDPAERFQRLVNGMMDRVEQAIAIVPPEAVQALRTLTGALKDLRDLQGLNRTALDIEEQQARIAKLRSETRIVDGEESGGVLILPEIEETLLPPALEGGSDDA